MALTEAGEVHLERIEPLNEQVSRARDDAASLHTEPDGLLRLSASVAFGQTCLVPLLPQLRAEYPKLRVELALTDRFPQGTLVARVAIGSVRPIR